MDRMRDADRLAIAKLPQGGFVVYGYSWPGEMAPALFASREIGDALTFIAEAMQSGVQPADADDAEVAE